MAYVLDQYNYWDQDDSSIFASYTGTNAQVARLMGETNDLTEMVFNNECIYLPTTFEINANYYLHIKVQKKESVQKFNVKLMSVSEPSSSGLVIRDSGDDKEQYVKTVNISGGNFDEFVDVEFMFSPLSNEFNCIVFELARIQQDYIGQTRYPKILYEELSYINNLIGNNATGIPGIRLIKLGVQSKPGLMMCINNEEIRNSRTGIFEIKNGIMTVNFFSVMNAAEEATSVVQDRIAALSASHPDPEDPNKQVPDIPWDDVNQQSTCYFSNSKKPRKISSFSLDYMYQSNSNNGGGQG